MAATIYEYMDFVDGVAVNPSAMYFTQCGGMFYFHVIH